MLCNSKLTVFAGLNGSGKTSIAVNAALFLGRQEKRRFDSVILADLDIVNPYFRSKDAEKALLEAGVTFISSEYAGSGLEVPALPKAVEKIFTASGQIIIDVGGDEAGSTVLGRYSKEILMIEDRQFYLVFNPYRLLTQTVADTM
ncbi:MAG: ATP-binding protein, partial [Treponema sp.]|nr:ATP-binding protein [Treponema sp.]